MTWHPRNGTEIVITIITSKGRKNREWINKTLSIFDVSIGLCRWSIAWCLVEKWVWTRHGHLIKLASFKSKMVNRPDSSSTRSDKSSSSTRSSMIRNNNKKNVNPKGSFVRSKSGNDYNEKSANKMKSSSSLQSIAKTSGNQSLRGSGMRKFKSNGRSVQLWLLA